MGCSPGGYIVTNINIVESRWDAPPGGYIVTNINIVESRWDVPLVDILSLILIL